MKRRVCWVCSVSQAHKTWSRPFLFKDFVPTIYRGGVLRDDPYNGWEGDYIQTHGRQSWKMLRRLCSQLSAIFKQHPPQFTPFLFSGKKFYDHRSGNFFVVTNKHFFWHLHVPVCVFWNDRLKGYFVEDQFCEKPIDAQPGRPVVEKASDSGWRTKQVSVSWLLPHSSRQNQSVVFTWAEWLSIMFTSNGRREFVPRDQVSSLLVAYCSLFLHLN